MIPELVALLKVQVYITTLPSFLKIYKNVFKLPIDL